MFLELKLCFSFAYAKCFMGGISRFSWLDAIRFSMHMLARVFVTMFASARCLTNQS